MLSEDKQTALAQRIATELDEIVKKKFDELRLREVDVSTSINILMQAVGLTQWRVYFGEWNKGQ